MLYPSIVSRFSRTSRWGLAVCALGGLAVWTACDKSPTPQPLVAKSNVSVPVDPTVAGSVVGTSFTFPAGAGAFAPADSNQTLSISFGGTASALTSSGTITSPSGAAVGSFTSTVSFGSCDFHITSITGNPGFAKGDVIRVDPCQFNVQTTGVVAGSTNSTTTATIVFGNETSKPAPVSVTVGTDGTVTVNGTTVGTVTVTPATGVTGPTGP